MNDEIKRPKNFIPKMFKVFTLYIIVTLSVFFGYVEIYGDVSPVFINLIEGGADAEDENPFSGFLMSLGNFQNVHAQDLDLTFENSDMRLNVVGDVTFDGQNNRLAFDVDVTYNGNVFDVGALYTSPDLYLTIENNIYKFDTNIQSSGSVDFTQIFEFISQNINVDLSFVDEIGETLGIDFENFDIANLQSMLDVSDSKQLEDGGFEIIVRLGKVLSAQILCDENYNVTAAKLNDNIVINGNAIKFNAPHVVMNASSVEDRFVVPSDEEIIDLTALTKFVEFGENLFDNPFINTTVEVSADGRNYLAHILVDMEDSLKIKAFTTVEGIDVTVAYVDDIIYFDAEGVSLEFTVEDYQKWEVQINAILEKVTGKTVAEYAQEMISQIINSDTDDTYAKLLTVLETAFENSEKINAFLPDSTIESDHEFAMLWENGLKISLTEQDQMLSNVTVDFQDLSLNADFVLAESGVSVSGQYYNVSNLLPAIEVVKDIVENDQFAFDFALNYNGLKIVGVLKYNDNILEIADVDIAGEKLYLRLQNNNIYITYGNMKLKYPIANSENNAEQSDWKAIVNKLLNDEFGVDIQFGVFEEVLYMLRDYTAVDYINNLYLTTDGDANSFNIAVTNLTSNTEMANLSLKFVDNQFEGVTLEIYRDATSDFACSIDLTMSADSSPISKEIDDAEYTTDFVEGLLDSAEFETNVYAFSSDLAIRYSTNTFYGELVAMLVKEDDKYLPAISVYTTSLGLSSYIYLIDEIVYVDIHGLQLKAKLNETTIAEIMSFVEEKFGVELSGETLKATEETFKVILPALDKIYGQWATYVSDKTYKGIQISFKDGLRYTENATFHDIIVQAFLENYQNTIMPTRIVMGANIEDENTILPEGGYDDEYFKESWLVDEDEITKNLNFGVYLTNISVGRYVESLKDIFGTDLKDITAVKSNNANTKLDDFNDYKTVLDLIEIVYDYGTSMHYNVNVNASIDGTKLDGSNNPIDTKILLSGGLKVAIDDLQKDEEGVSIGDESQFEMFDGKKFNVQGTALDIKLQEKSSFETEYTETAEHIIDLLYGSDAGGLYLTYTHDNKIDGSDLTNNIGNYYLRAKIANTNMSDIVSMLLGFANVELSEDMMSSWHLEKSTTDFTFIQSLLGLEKKETDDTVSKVDGILSSITEATKMLKNIKLEKIQNEQDRFDTVLSMQLDTSMFNDSENEQLSTIKLVIKEEMQNETVSKALRQITVEDLIAGDSVINLEINLNDYDYSKMSYAVDAQGNDYVESDANFDYDTTKEHIDFSNLSSFVDAVVNTVNQRTYNFSGAMTANIIGMIKLNIDVDIEFSIDETGTISAYMQFVTTPEGLASIAFSGLDGDKRASILKYENDYLYLYRYDIKNNIATQESIDKAQYHKSEIVDNLTNIIKDAFGFNDTVFNLIVSIIENLNLHPTLERAITNYQKIDNGYVLTLNGKNLLGSDSAQDINITFGTKTVAGLYTYEVTTEEDGVTTTRTVTTAKNYEFIDSISTAMALTGIDITLDLNSASGQSYNFKNIAVGDATTTYPDKIAFTNEYFRNLVVNEIYKQNPQDMLTVNLYHNNKLVYKGYYFAGQTISTADFVGVAELNERAEFYYMGSNEAFTEFAVSTVGYEINLYFRNYYKVEFDMSLNYIPKDCAAGCSYVTAPTELPTLNILEGEVLDLSESQYQQTCRIAATAFGLTKYNYKSTTWGTTKHSDYKDGGDGFTSIIITKDITLYPYWKKI